MNIGVLGWGGLYDRDKSLQVDKALQLADPVAVAKVIKENEFNDYSIRCQGYDQSGMPDRAHITFKVNGLTSVDGRYDGIRAVGNLCFYTQAGLSPPEIAFRNVQIKELPAK